MEDIPAMNNNKQKMGNNNPKRVEDSEYKYMCNECDQYDPCVLISLEESIKPTLCPFGRDGKAYWKKYKQ